MQLHACGRWATSAVLALLTFAVAVLTAVVTPGVARASSDPGLEAQFVAQMNAERQSRGLAPYRVAADLTSVARSHSERMAAQGSLYHNPSLTSDVHNWRAVGENVGDGPNASDIHQAFMNSPEHRSNILDGDFTEVGVGVTVDRHGIVWVTQDFRLPMTAASAPAPASAPTSTHSGQSAASTSAGGTVQTAAAPGAPVQAAPSPRALLLERLRTFRRDARHSHRTDPVAQGFDYLSALSRLAG